MENFDIPVSTAWLLKHSDIFWAKKNHYHKKFEDSEKRIKKSAYCPGID